MDSRGREPFSFMSIDTSRLTTNGTSLERELSRMSVNINASKAGVYSVYIACTNLELPSMAQLICTKLQADAPLYVQATEGNRSVKDHLLEHKQEILAREKKVVVIVAQGFDDLVENSHRSVQERLGHDWDQNITEGLSRDSSFTKDLGDKRCVVLTWIDNARETYEK